MFLSFGFSLAVTTHCFFLSLHSNRFLLLYSLSSPFSLISYGRTIRLCFCFPYLHHVSSIAHFLLFTFSLKHPYFMDFQEPPKAFFSNTDIIDHYKRRKEMEDPSFQSCSPSLFISSILSDLAPQIKQQREQIDRFLHDHCERLRRALVETQRRHHVALLGSAESLTTRRLREKEAELDRAVQHGAELEDRITNLKSDLMAWQSKALSYQSTAASLHARLQQAAAAAQAQQAGPSDEPVANPAEDAESAYIDQDRVEPIGAVRLCKVCRARAVSVVLLPCRHLCLCEFCDVAARCDGACPICHCVSTGCVQVFFA